MLLNKKLISKIKASLLLKPEVKESILTNWDTLSPQSQEDILTLLGESFDMQELLMTSAAKKDDNLEYGIKKQVQNYKLRLLREDEEQEDKESKKKLILDY